MSIDFVRFKRGKFIIHLFNKTDFVRLPLVRFKLRTISTIVMNEYPVKIVMFPLIYEL